MQRRFIPIVAIFGLLAGLLSALSPQSAIAAGVVGDGTPGSCDEAAFDAALIGGGLITFDCGNQLFVNLTTAKTISVDTHIQGPLNIILTMGNNDRHFIVNPGVTLTLESVGLRNGQFAGNGGSILNQGTVIASRLFMRDNVATGDGGAIYNDGGTVTIQDRFGLVANQAQNGGAIANSAGGTVTVRDGNFQSNRSNVDGGAIANFSGTVTVENTNVGLNIANNQGGGIWNDGILNLAYAYFDRNEAQSSSNGSGGAIYNRDGAVLISGSTFLLNTAATRGGAIFNSNVLTNNMTIQRSQFTSNSAGGRGGAIHNDATMSVTDSSFVGNSTDESGGGINNSAGATLTMTRNVIVQNIALDRGGGLRNGGVATVETSTFSGNAASVRGGGIMNQGQVTVSNSTLAFNEAPVLEGGGIDNSGAGIVNLNNTIVSNSINGNDCSNAGTFTSGDHNLDSDTTCPLGMPNDISGGNANLQPLALNGGTTENHLPGFGSDAIDAGPAACTSPDQRGEVRPQNGVCDIGAVEVIPPADVCVNLQTGFLQAPTGGECNGPFLRKIVFEDNGPHYLCRNISTGLLSYSYAPTCQPYNIPAIVMPDAAPLAVCLKFYTKQYRQPLGPQPCVYGEYATTLQ